MEPLKEKQKVLFKYIDLTKYVKQKPNAKFEDMVYIPPNQCIVLFSQLTLAIYLKNNQKHIIVVDLPKFQKILKGSQRWLIPSSNGILLFQWKKIDNCTSTAVVTIFAVETQKKNSEEQVECPQLVFESRKMYNLKYHETFNRCRLILGDYFSPRQNISTLDSDLNQTLNKMRPIKEFQNFIINQKFCLEKFDKKNLTAKPNIILEFPKDSQISICKVDRFKKLMVILVQDRLEKELIFFNYEQQVVVSRIKHLKGVSLPILAQTVQNILYRNIHQSVNVNKRINQDLSRFFDIEVTNDTFNLICYEYALIKKLLMHLSVGSGIFERFGSDLVRKVIQLIE